MIIHDLMLDVSIVMGMGNSNAISTSKIMKITAIRKNRDENGSRAEFLGSSPHSKGDLFSRSSLIFFEINVASIMIIDESMMVIVAVVMTIIIIYLVFTNFLIGSQVYFLVLDKYYFIFLISRLRYIGIIRLRLQSVSIMLLLQTQSGGLMRSVELYAVVGM